MRFKVQAVIAAASFCAALLGLPGPAAADPQYQVLYTFCPSGGTCNHGKSPNSKLVLDANGNLYGTTSADSGLIYSLSPDGHETVLHQFCGSCGEGTGPVGTLVMDVNGNLYGVTQASGAGNSGTIFKLTRHRKTWTLTTLYSFCTQPNCADGAQPMAGLTYDGAQSGAPYDGKSPLFGTTAQGGPFDGGVAFEVAFKKTGHGRRPVYSPLYDFCQTDQCSDGANPEAALLPDGKGNFFGTTVKGGNGNKRDGVFFELTRNHANFTESVIYNFCHSTKCADGSTPGTIVSDGTGNMLGITSGGGANRSGIVYRMSPGGSQSILYSFCAQTSCTDGAAPNDITLAPDGSVWGTTPSMGANGAGTLFSFKDTTLTVLYAFCSASSCSDGGQPLSGVTFDASGNAYGTTSAGGSEAVPAGTVYKVTP
jgi:uncharacterized repeat protein (TIGR03803 family)